MQAGASEQGQDIAAATADVVYSAEHELEPARAYYAGLKARVARWGRDTDSLRIMPGLVPIIGRTAQEAHEKFVRLQHLIHPPVGLSYLYTLCGDLSGSDLDGPVPEAGSPAIRSFARVLLDKAPRRTDGPPII